ncbi:phage tail tape measure protein [Lentilactobacillus farraginis]|uniref:Phage tail tape measure protein, TP901 family n=1 Tax=Lentilactobacillus farraginis DSM 18382 = JCM 14108 TaxID=1423743 RepID=A0A0R1W300_9LACO|nr:phage tail tape measure protein [Lentilactobacillus farraginis]KRM11941.1 phage tail tape measure protein, TP901 family [Lentilactobacillus farraginis DSM 18382 = JCM 14108]
MGYARSAKVGFRVVSENMDAIDRANDKMDRLIRSSREANNQLSHFGNRMSVQGLTKFEDKYDSLISKSKKMSDRLTSDADQISNRYKSLADSYRESAKQISKAFSDTSKEARNSIKHLPKEAKLKVKTNLKQTSADVDHTRTRIERLGNRGKMSLDRISKSGHKTTKSFRSLYDAGNDFVNISSQIAIGAGIIGGAFLKSANEATNLQNKYITIKNLLKTGGESTSQSKRETAAMQKENNRFALQYGVSPTDMAKGGEELIRRGYNGKQELASHKYFLQAARASGDPYNSVVNYGAPTLEQFGYKAKAGNSRKKMAAYTKKVLNEMAYGSDLTATNFEGMGNALRYVGATAHSSNQGLARTVAGVGVLSNNGQDGSIAGTGLRKVMNAFAAPNTTMKSQQGQIMSALNLKPSDFQKANGQVKTLADNMDVLKKATAGMSSAEKFNVFHMFFGTTGQESGLILANNTKQLRSLTGQVSRAQKYGKNGYIASLAKKNMASWKNQIDVFKQYLNVMGMGFTKTVLPLFTKALGVANKFLKVLIGLPSPIKKAAGYAAAFAGVWGGLKVSKGLLGLSGRMLGMGSSKSRASMTSRAVSAVSDIEQAEVGSRVAGRRVPLSSTRSGSTHFAQSRLGAMTSSLSSDRLLKGMSYATIGLQIGGHAVSAFKKGVDSKQGGSQMWQAGGNAVGAGIGLALSGGNPLVAMIGSSVGGSIAKSIAGSKYVKNLNEVDKKHQSNPYRTNQVWTGNGDRQNSAEKRIIHHKGYSTDIYGMMVPDDSKTKHAKKATSLGLDKSGKRELKSFTSSFNKANQNWATVSKGTGSKINRNVYGNMRRGLKSYTNSEKLSSNKRVQMLLKEGVITKKQAASMEKSDNKYWSKRYSNASKGISKLTRSERNGGKGREAAISATNRAVSRLLTNNTNKETIIYGRLKNRTSKLSQSQARSIIRSSYKTMKSTVNSANKTYKSAKSAANKKYNSVRNAADKEYYVTHSISKKQHDKIIANARSQRDKTISAARTTKNKTIDSAETMHEKVVQKTSAMVKGNLKQMNTWTGKMKGIWSRFGDWWGNLWGGLTKLGHLGTKAMASNLTPELEKMNSLLSQMKNGKKNPKKSKRTASTDASRLPGNVFAANALGTRNASTHTHMALIGESGEPELAYTVMGRKARLLGANGPQITRVKAGEKILNAKDTKRVLTGNYGQALPGYATGNTKLTASSNKSLKAAKRVSKKTIKDYSDLQSGSSKQLSKFSKSSNSKWSSIHKSTAKYTGKTQKQTVIDYDQLQKGSYKQLRQFDKGNTSRWRNISSDTKHYTTKSKNQAISTYNSIQKGVQKQVNQMQSGVISSGKATAIGFGHALGKMDNYAHSAMSNTVHQLNGGIKGIDKVLGQFGGNSSVINAIHYAKGSNGELPNDQLAIVNDAKSGPRQESIIRNNSLLIPHGNDRMIPLKKRDRVLNGSQTQKLGRLMGIQHFAKGSGVSHSELNKIISKNNAHPNKAFSNEFSSKISKSNTVLGNAIKGLSKRATTKYGDPWSTEVWHQMDNARSSEGSGTYGSGTWLHNPGNGFGVSSGFGYRGPVAGGLSIHDGVDFSGGHVVHAVHPGKVIRSGGAPNGWGGSSGIGQNMVTKSADGYYVIYQEFNGKNNSGAHTYVSVGDDVNAGQKIAALGPAGTHVHIGVSKHNPFSNNPDSTSGWFDVTKMRSTKAKKAAKKNKQASSALSKLVSKEIAPQLKWVKKHLRASNIGSLGLSGSIASRAKTLYDAIKSAYPSATKKGIEAVLGNWLLESGLNPGIQNSIGASGLGQWYKGRFTALKAYAKKHGASWKNAGAQIGFALNGDSSNSSILKSVLRGKGSVSSLAAKFSSEWERGGHTGEHVADAVKVAALLHNNGGWSTKNKLNIYGEKDPEVAINPKKPNADGLIASAIGARSKVSSSVFSNESIKKMHKALLENLKNYNPLKGLPNQPKHDAKGANNVTVNLNMNITVNANDKNAGAKVANDISKAVKEQVQAMFGQKMATRERGTA